MLLGSRCLRPVPFSAEADGLRRLRRLTQRFRFLSGVEPVQVQETVENHLKSLLIKHFDPRKADSIFTEEGEVRNIVLSSTSQGCLLAPCVQWCRHVVEVLRAGCWVVEPLLCCHAE